MGTRRNVLFLLTDQHRWDSYGANTGLVRTPNLDGIAEEGVRFTNAYTCNPLCSPARASILTGQYPHEHKVIVNIEDFNGLSSRLDPSKPTFMSRFADAGYRVGYVGKWHVGPHSEKPAGVERWEHIGKYYETLRNQGINWNMWEEDKKTMTGPDATFYSRLPVDEKLAPAKWVADQTIETIRDFAKGGSPFCIYASWYGPHFPITVPEPYFSMYDPETIPKPDNFDETFKDKPELHAKERWRWNAEVMTWERWREAVARYRGFCTFIDSHVGRILDVLRESGEYDNTLIVFAADHGCMLGNHGMFNKGFNFYEEAMHVPLAVRLPKGVRNVVNERFISTVDICPTLLEYAGAEEIQPCHGFSLMPFLEGKEPDVWRDVAFSQFHGYETTLFTQRMLRTRRYKYCYNPGDIDELYDMEKDPGELVNLAGDNTMKSVLEEMRSLLHSEMLRYGETCIETCSYGIGPNRRISGRWDN